MILGAILAGGASSRFGSDKALHLWHGRPLLAHALDALKPFCDSLLVAGREAIPGIAAHFVPDRPAPGLGPLGGLAAALHFAAENSYARVLTAGCDTPVIPPAILLELIATPGAAALSGLPVIGIWPATLAAPLDAYISSATENRARSIRGLAQAASAQMLDLPPPPNLNRPQDLASLEGLP